MILWMSDTDNLMIIQAHDMVTVRYGLLGPIVDRWPTTGSDRMDTRCSREWVINNVW